MESQPEESAFRGRSNNARQINVSRQYRCIVRIKGHQLAGFSCHEPARVGDRLQQHFCWLIDERQIRVYISDRHTGIVDGSCRRHTGLIIRSFIQTDDPCRWRRRWRRRRRTGSCARSSATTGEQQDYAERAQYFTPTAGETPAPVFRYYRHNFAQVTWGDYHIAESRV